MSPPGFDGDGNPTGDSRIPMDYLNSLFGPDVGPAMEKIKLEREKRKRGEASELMDLLISRRWLDLFGPFTNQPKDVAATLEARVRK